MCNPRPAPDDIEVAWHIVEQILAVMPFRFLHTANVQEEFPHLPAILTDSEAIGRMGAEHLLDRGSYRFAYSNVRRCGGRRGEAPHLQPLLLKRATPLPSIGESGLQASVAGSVSSTAWRLGCTIWTNRWE